MSQAENARTQKFITIASLVLAIYGNVRYLVGRSPFDPKGSFNVSDTPFTSNILLTLIFWGVLYLLQISYVIQVFLPSIENSVERFQLSKDITWHFTIFNILSFAWSLLFARKHFFFSELVLLVNFFNVLALYFSHKTYSLRPLSSWFLIHLPITAFPLSWLLYAIFWNGAVLFHIHKFVGRVICNVLIWDFLLVPGFFLLAFNDWGVGLSSSFLCLSLGFGQLFTKLFALQWIFAFIIAGILFVGTVITAVNGSIFNEATNNNDTSPLLDA